MKDILKVMFHFKICSFVIFVFLFEFSCSPCIGRRIIPKHTVELEGFATALLGDSDASIPALPNLGVVLRYGLHDKITIGTTLDLLGFALEGSLLMEPFSVFNLVQQNGKLPSINIYVGTPFVFFFKANGLSVFPILGICPNLHSNKFDAYAAYEASFDSNPYATGIDVHSSVRLGGTFYPKSFMGIYGELGLLNINHPSWINNSKTGVFSISLGITQNFTQRRNSRKK